MKRTSMTTAIVAGIAGVAGISNMANAVFLNPDGLGSVLVYPYYTVNGGNATLLSVVNTTSEGKAIKVRFLEAYNSREVLDFNLYMSGFDVWVAEVAATSATSAATVFTNDNSCTVPKIPSGGQPFRTAAFDGGTAQGKDGGPTGVARTREGYVELIEMGTVTNETSSTLSAITHGSSGVPSNCNQVVAAWSGGGYWAADSGRDISAPDGGLFGSGSIINIGEGTIAAYNAEAIDQFYLTASAAQHTQPGSLHPSIAEGTSPVSYVFANGGLVTTDYTPFPINAVSSLFMVDNVYNEYVVDPGLNAATEWVVMFPTKRFYVDKPSLYVGGSTPQKPFDVLFTSANGGTSCSPVGLQFWNREEATTTTGVDFSPAPTAAGTSLCWEAQVVTFNQGGTASTVLGSALQANIDLTPVGFTSGWARIDFTTDSLGATQTNHQLPTAPAASGSGDSTLLTGNVFLGLPSTGFAVIEYVNGNIGGALANYTGLYRHKFHRTCVNDETGCS
jgi:hypothetical protein